jgi:uncharacterized coiled-coil protein SlyX
VGVSQLSERIEPLEKAIDTFQAQTLERLEKMEKENSNLLTYLDSKMNNKIQLHIGNPSKT